MPAVATTIAIGSSRISGLVGLGFGSSGGHSTTTAMVSIGGAGKRVARTKSIGEYDVAAASLVPSRLRKLWCARRTQTAITLTSTVSALREVVAVSVCRISIQLEHDNGRAVDMAVSARTPVGALLPAITDVLGQASTLDVVRGWRLDRAVGPPLDESLSLTDNDIHDGELLVLTTSHAPMLGRVSASSERTVASVGSPSVESGGRLRDSACAAAFVVAAAALAWTGVATGAVGHLIVAACAAGAVCWTAVTTRSAAVAMAGCAFVATTGFLTVPSGPGAANVFLSATAVFAAALVMTRLLGHPNAVLTATACCAAVTAISTGVAVFAALPPATLGAVLVTGALGLLAVAPRLTTLLAGLGPRRDAEPDEAFEARARTGHTTLTGAVAGCAAAVAAGTLLTAVGCIRAETSPFAGGAFGLVAGMVLLLRTRTYVDPSRRVALVAGGLLSVTAAFSVVCAAAPDRAGLVTVGLIAVGLGACRGAGPTPFTSRCADLLDYAALTAVVPLAGWVIGVYGMARGWQLT